MTECAIKISVVFIVLVSAGGCQNRETSNEPNDVAIIDNLGIIESIHVEMRVKGSESATTCVLPKGKWNDLRVCLENRVREKDPQKWEIIGTITIRSKGRKVEMHILGITNKENEGALRVSIDEYWRGVDLTCLAKIVSDCA